jgi:hypothetical protein
MIFVWGRKRTERKQGKVADFCPVCREIRSFELIRVGIAGHVYYVSFGEGQLAGYIVCCDYCRLGMGAQPTRYQSAEKRYVGDLENLIHTTFPTLRSDMAPRLALEEQLKRTRTAISNEQRGRFLLEPFGLLNPQVESRFGNSSAFDKQSGLGCLGTVLVGGGLFFGSLAFRGSAQDNLLIAAAILFGLGTIYTFAQLHFAPQRFVKAKILPVLVRALEPLEPTQDEIKGCLDQCKSTGMKIGSALKPVQIWNELQSRALAGAR